MLFMPMDAYMVDLEVDKIKPLDFERGPLPLMDAKGLPISCLFLAPTAGNVGSSGTTAGNSQVFGRKEDELESAIGT